MIQKTYGISFLVDWKAQINAGKARVIVHFTGGALTAYGVTPAEYTTADPFFQHVIEGSSYFKEGRITLLRETEVPDTPAERARKARIKAAEAKKVAANVVNNAAETTATEIPAPTPTAEDNGENTPESGEDAGEEANDYPDEGENAGTASNKIVVNAACKEDVIEYLKINYNYTATSLRTKQALMQAIAEHNLEVVGVEL